MPDVEANGESPESFHSDVSAEHAIDQLCAILPPTAARNDDIRCVDTNDEALEQICGPHPPLLLGGWREALPTFAAEHEA